MIAEGCLTLLEIRLVSPGLRTLFLPTFHLGLRRHWDWLEVLISVIRHSGRCTSHVWHYLSKLSFYPYIHSPWKDWAMIIEFHGLRVVSCCAFRGVTVRVGPWRGLVICYLATQVLTVEHRNWTVMRDACFLVLHLSSWTEQENKCFFDMYFTRHAEMTVIHAYAVAEWQGRACARGGLRAHSGRQGPNRVERQRYRGGLHDG